MAGEQVMWLAWHPGSARSFHDQTEEFAKQFASISRETDWPSLVAAGWCCSRIVVKETDGEPSREELRAACASVLGDQNGRVRVIKKLRELTGWKLHTTVDWINQKFPRSDDDPVFRSDYHRGLAEGRRQGLEEAAEDTDCGCKERAGVLSATTSAERSLACGREPCAAAMAADIRALIKDDEGMTKIYITKYALSSGILCVDAKIDGDMAIYALDPMRHHNKSFAHTEGVEWHRTTHAAIARADAMRVAKIASLHRQIKGLAALVFDAGGAEVMSDRCVPEAGTERLRLFLLRKEGDVEPRLARWLGGIHNEWSMTGFDGLSTVYRAERLALAGYSIIRAIPTPSDLAAAREREAGLAAENAKLRQFACRVCDAWDAIGGALETSSDVDDFNECEQATFELRSALDGETP